MKRRIVIIAVVIATALIVWLFMRERAESVASRITVVSNGPLDIRLWGIRPDDGDTIYDPNGKVIKKTPGIVSGGRSHWGKDSQRFDFIFEAPPNYESSKFGENVTATPSSGEKYVVGSPTQFLLEYEGRRLIWQPITWPRTFKRPVLGGLWKADTPFDNLDVTLSYYGGSPGKSVFSLEGPFEPNSTLTSEDGKYEVSFGNITDESRGLIEFTLSMEPPCRTNLKAFLYDESGKRRLAAWVARPNLRVGQIGYREIDISPSRIALITFGEEFLPHQTTFKNVNLNIFGKKRRTHADYLDEMADRLGLTVTGDELVRYEFKTAAEAMEVIDIVRGHHLRNAFKALSSTPFLGVENEPLDPEDLTDEQTERLKQTLGRWLTAIDPEIQACGVEIGLQCKWPEFVDAALEALERPVPPVLQRSQSAQCKVAAALIRHNAELSDAQVRRIEDLISDEGLERVRPWLADLLRKRAAQTRD